MDVRLEDVVYSSTSTAVQVEVKDNADGLVGTIDSDENVKYVFGDMETEMEGDHHVDEGYVSEDQGGEVNTSEDTSARKENEGEEHENIEPYVGMEFESQCAARSFYNDYAKRAGFGTRISYSHRSKRDRKMIGQQYVCVKEGFPVNKDGPSKLPRSSARIGCKASMTVKRVNSGKLLEDLKRSIIMS